MALARSALAPIEPATHFRFPLFIVLLRWNLRTCDALLNISAFAALIAILPPASRPAMARKQFAPEIISAAEMLLDSISQVRRPRWRHLNHSSSTATHLYLHH